MVCTRPSASAPQCSTPARTRRSRTWSSLPLDGSIGTTLADFTVASGWFHQTTTKPPTTQPSPRNCNHYRSGKEPAAVQTAVVPQIGGGGSRPRPGKGHLGGTDRRSEERRV